MTKPKRTLEEVIRKLILFKPTTPGVYPQALRYKRLPGGTMFRLSVSSVLIETMGRMTKKPDSVMWLYLTWHEKNQVLRLETAITVRHLFDHGLPPQSLYDLIQQVNTEVGHLTKFHLLPDAHSKQTRAEVVVSVPFPTSWLESVDAVENHLFMYLSQLYRQLYLEADRISEVIEDMPVVQPDHRRRLSTARARSPLEVN